jgi:hypothetical protein
MATAKLAVTMTAQDESTLTGSTRKGANISFSEALLSLAAGTGAGKVSVTHQSDFSVGTSGTTLDLNALAAAATNTGAAVFTKIRGFLVFNNDTTNNLLVGNAASTQFSPGWSTATNIETVAPKGFVARGNPTAAGWDAATAKNLKLASSAGTVAGTLILFGE